MSGSSRKTLKNATFRVPTAIWRRAKKRAVDEDRSLNDVVVSALENFAGPRLAQGSRLLADADAFLKRRGKNRPAPHFTPDELHERDDA